MSAPWHTPLAKLLVHATPGLDLFRELADALAACCEASVPFPDLGDGLGDAVARMLGGALGDGAVVAARLVEVMQVQRARPGLVLEARGRARIDGIIVETRYGPGGWVRAMRLPLHINVLDVGESDLSGRIRLLWPGAVGGFLKAVADDNHDRFHEAWWIGASLAGVDWARHCALVTLGPDTTAEARQLATVGGDKPSLQLALTVGTYAALVRGREQRWCAPAQAALTGAVGARSGTALVFPVGDLSTKVTVLDQGAELFIAPSARVPIEDRRKREEVAAAIAAAFATPRYRGRIHQVAAVSDALRILDLPDAARPIGSFWELCSMLGTDASDAVEPLGEPSAPQPESDAIVFPFEGRDDELAALTAWASAPIDPGRRIEVKALYAPAGAGKTRLAEALVAGLRRIGVVAGFARPDGALPDRRRLMRDEGVRVIVIDDADRSATQLRALTATPGAATLRLLVAARHLGGWWPSVSDKLKLECSATTSVVRLSPLYPAPTDREAAFKRACAVLHTLGAAASDHASAVPAAWLAESVGHPRDVQLAARLWSYGDDAAASSALLDALLAHERGHWAALLPRTPDLSRRDAPARAELAERVRAIERLVVHATLLGSMSRRAAAEHPAFGWSEATSGLSRFERRRIVSALSEWYASELNAEGIAPLAPAGLAEHVVLRLWQHEEAVRATDADAPDTIRHAVRAAAPHELATCVAVLERVQSRLGHTAAVPRAADAFSLLRWIELARERMRENDG